MAKYRRSWSQATFNKYLKEGRGQGHSAQYKPWITIHDFPSQGRSHRALGWKTGRVQHFLSDHEMRYLYLLDWSDSVTDVREQFPLIEYNITQEIAKDMGVKHPIDAVSGFPYVLTTDFLISIYIDGKTVEIARTVKPAKELESTRVIEKFEIERRYWMAKGIDWGIVTEHEIPRTLAANIDVIHSAYKLEATPEMDIPNLLLLARTLKDRLRTGNGSISGITTKLDEEMNLSGGTSLAVFKHLLARKEVLLDMSKKLDFTCSVKSIQAIAADSSYGAISA
jgi:hypothetical protein